MSQDQQQPPPQTPQKKYLLLGTAAVLLIGAFLFGRWIDIPATYGNAASQEPASQTASSTYQIDVFETDLIIGELENPVITLVEYGSMTCPHCADFHNNIASVLKNKYAEKPVIFIYRDYPLEKFALKAAILARCDESKRQAFVDIIYKKQKSWIRGSESVILQNLNMLAKMGGLSLEAYAACQEDQALIEKIVKERKYGSDHFAIDATPTILINGKKAPNGEDIEYFTQEIDDLLASVNQTHDMAQ
ncbi:MAG: thioredoxin domain-containing protein [Pseudomonadota bacterium]